MCLPLSFAMKNMRDKREYEVVSVMDDDAGKCFTVYLLCNFKLNSVWHVNFTMVISNLLIDHYFLIVLFNIVCIFCVSVMMSIINCSPL